VLRLRKTLGEWLEEIIEEKVAREKRQEAQLKQKDLPATGLSVV